MSANPVLERIPELRRVTNKPAIRRLLTIARQHHLVREPLKFALGELRGGTHSYHLAADPRYSVVVRHRTGDMGVFAEIFSPPSAYEPPPQAADALGAVADRQPLRVLDLGGNIGLFAVYVMAHYRDAEIVSYEPEPENFRVLARCAARNASLRWHVLQACAMTSDAPVRISPGEFAHSHVSDRGVEVPGIDVLPILPDFDFVKMDIEGSEWPILQDRRWPAVMRSVSVLALEWHERGCSTGDPRAKALAAVEAAGFTTASSPPGWAHGMVWGWRPPSGSTVG